MYWLTSTEHIASSQNYWLNHGTCQFIIYPPCTSYIPHPQEGFSVQRLRCAGSESTLTPAVFFWRALLRLWQYVCVPTGLLYTYKVRLKHGVSTPHALYAENNQECTVLLFGPYSCGGQTNCMYVGRSWALVRGVCSPGL